jgi:GNAT superfamily N-acetyltransferase
MDEIKARAIANGTFMKAPNGKKSNLTERQWLQVRTEAFKKWFGDRIGNPFANNVSLGAGTFNADNADMSGYRPEFPFFVDGKFAGSFHFENLVINRDGENITDDKYLTFPEVGWALELEPEFRGKGYGKAMYYEAAKVAARKGRSLRSASLSNMSDDAKHVWESLVKNGYAKLEDNHYVFNNDKLDYSKVVDENGEPLVVYHGTIDKFSEFNKGYSKWYGETGIFFSSDRDYAESMSIFKALHKPIWRASEDDNFYNIPVFLNIKNPAQINDISNSTVGEYRKKLERHSSIDGVVGHDAYYEDDDLPRSKGVEYVAFNPN